VDIINTIGAQKVIFGSDYPWGSPKYDVDRFIGLNLADDKKRMILSENSIKLFGLKNI
jgi:uncharacterized protein